MSLCMMRACVCVWAAGEDEDVEGSDEEKSAAGDSEATLEGDDRQVTLDGLLLVLCNYCMIIGSVA